MSKINVSICEFCKKPDCDGIRMIPVNKNFTKSHWTCNWSRNLCKGNEDVVKRGTKYFYHWVMGHGIENYYELEPKEIS